MRATWIYEGGFAYSVEDRREALDVLMDAIKKPGHEDEVKIGIDVASSEFHRDGEYDSGFESPDSSPEMQKRRRSGT